MLYVTTRSREEYYPALRTLGQNQGPDGGLYIPSRLPQLSDEEIDGLKDLGFGECVAKALNLLLPSHLTGTDVCFTIGRTPVKLHTMNHRIVIAESWQNPHWNFQWAVHSLTQRMRTQSQLSDQVTEWASIAVRIAMLFGIYGELSRSGLADREHPVDVAVSTGEFIAPMAAWYARKMGLPVGCVICGSIDNAASWDLLHRGELRTCESAVGEKTDRGNDSVPRGIERLISEQLGTDEVRKYCAICRSRGIYAPTQDRLEQLQQGIFAAVVGQSRVNQVTASVYRTNGYLLAPDTALIYAGLQDYRATVGEGRLALLFAEQNPADTLDQASDATGVNTEELKLYLEQL